jgi:hypothetical protein
VFDDHKNDTHQEHDNGYFVNPVHHFQIDIAGFVLFFTAEEVTEDLVHGEKFTPAGFFFLTHKVLECLP